MNAEYIDEFYRIFFFLSQETTVHEILKTLTKAEFNGSLSINWIFKKKISKELQWYLTTYGINEKLLVNKFQNFPINPFNVA